MKNTLAFAALAAAVLALGTWLLGMVFNAPGERQAVMLSAAVALVVQLVTFAALHLGGRERIMTMWGVGMLLRMATLTVFAFVVVSALGLPPVAALVSLATFLFVSSLLEPLLLNT